MENGFQGLEGQLVPDMPDDFVMSISERYQELFNAMTGNSLEKRDYNNILDTIETNVNNALNII
jgi:phosphoribosylaminoimidazole-succinocarboxamide synthase